MTNNLLIGGRIAFPHFVTPNKYSGKRQFDLTFPETTSQEIKAEIKKIVDGFKYDGYYDSIEHERVKSGAPQRDKGFTAFEGRDYITCKQDGFGWTLLDVNQSLMKAEDFGPGDYVRVAIAISAKSGNYGNRYYLNPKIIQLIKSAGHSRYAVSIDGEPMGEKLQEDTSTPPPMTEEKETDIW